METFFRELMTCPCQVYSKIYTQKADGTEEYITTLKETTVCHYHSIRVDLLEIADKENIKGAFVFCLPVDSLVDINDQICIENVYYTVVKKKQGNLRFETVCEAVSYEI